MSGGVVRAKIKMEKIITRSAQELKKEFIYHFSTLKPRKILFDHLPKCGGTSLNSYLESHYPWRKTFSTNGLNPIASVEEFLSFPESKRYRYDLVKGHLANRLIDYVHPKCLKVTMLRDPVDRIISHYYYAKRMPNHYLYPKIHEANMSLEDYIASDLSDELRNWYTTHFSMSTLAEVEQNPEKSIDNAIDALINKYDIVGFLDEFSFFIDTIRDEAKLQYLYQIEKKNVTQGRVAIKDVQLSTIKMIERFNQLDIELFRRIKEYTRNSFHKS